MTDIYSKQKRSLIMSKISGKDTGPEILVRKFLFANGLRFRINDKRYPGKPDILLPKYKTVVFINGCFWHGHNCSGGSLPKANKKFWQEKIGSNVKRDTKNKEQLEKTGWKVIVIWQCQIRTAKDKECTLRKLLKQIKGKN